MVQGFFHDVGRRATGVLGVAAGALALVAAAGVPAAAAAEAPSFPVSRDAGCADVGISGNAEWDKLSTAGYQRAAEASRDLGAGQVRVGAIWSDIERSQGQRDWSALDARMAALREQGLEPLLLIQGVPGWVSVPNTNQVTSEVVEIARQFGDFAGEVAQRYGRVTDSYEVWNEPNLDRFWPVPNSAQYGAFLKEAYAAIHQADDSAVVIAAGLAPAPDNLPQTLSPLTFLTELYDLGMNRYWDAVAVHPYSHPERPLGGSAWNTFGQLGQFRDLMVARGDGAKQIWLTEYGAPTSGFGGKPVSESEQVQFVVEAITAAREHAWLGPIFLYTLTDGDAGGRLSTEYHFGLYADTGRAKPVVPALRSLLAHCATVTDSGAVVLEHGPIGTGETGWTPGGGGTGSLGS